LKLSFIHSYSPSAPMSWMNDDWLAVRGNSVNTLSFPFRMSPRENHEVVLSDFALCACEYEFQLH